MRGVNSPLFTEGALIRDPRAVPNLCKADSGLSAMFGILAAISSHLVARCKILSYTCSCPTALRLRERRTKEQEFWPSHPPLVVLARGRVVRGPWGLAPVVATASFPLINLPNFYLSFTILVSLILVKYPDRVGLVNAMIWPRILVFTSMMLRVLTQQPLAVMELEFIFLSWGWFPSMYVLFDLLRICMIC